MSIIDPEGEMKPFPSVIGLDQVSFSQLNFQDFRQPSYTAMECVPQPIVATLTDNLEDLYMGNSRDN